MCSPFPMREGAPGLGPWAVALLVLTINTPPLMAQDVQTRPSLVDLELLDIVTTAEGKLISLAEAMPEDTYGWRPGEGVRSVAEVYMHVAGNNYWWPTQLGFTPPDGIPITGEYETVEAFEKPGSKQEVIAALKASFAYYKQVLAQISDERLGQEMDVFGTPGTVRTLLNQATVHFHEHLGQSIAYARMNGIVPPWSR